MNNLIIARDFLAHDQAGLTLEGREDDGDLIWGGTQEQWGMYEYLFNKSFHDEKSLFSCNAQHWPDKLAFGYCIACENKKLTERNQQDFRKLINEKKKKAADNSSYYKQLDDLGVDSDYDRFKFGD